MRTIVFLFVLVVLNPLCFAQTDQTETKRIMIKGQMVEVPVFTTPSSERSYYDAHPEEKALDATIQDTKPLRDMQEKLIEDTKTKLQGYQGGTENYVLPSPPPPTHPGAIDVRTGQFYPGVPGGIIDPYTGQFMPDVGGGYIDPMTGRFIPKQ